MPCPSCALTGHEDLFAVRRHRIGRGRLLSAAICPGCGFAEAVQRGCCCRRRPVSRCSLGCWLCMMRPMAGCKRCYGGLVGHGDHCISAPLTVQFIGRSSFGQVGQLTRELPLRMTACRFFEHWHFKMERPGSALKNPSSLNFHQQNPPPVNPQQREAPSSQPEVTHRVSGHLRTHIVRCNQVQLSGLQGLQANAQRHREVPTKNSLRLPSSLPAAVGISKFQ